MFVFRQVTGLINSLFSFYIYQLQLMVIYALDTDQDML